MSDLLREEIRRAFEAEYEPPDRGFAQRIRAAVSSQSVRRGLKVLPWAVGIGALFLIGLVLSTLLYETLLARRASPVPVNPPPVTSTSPPERLASIHMVTPSTGWATTRGHLFRTSDGGTHWSDVTPPIRPTSTDWKIGPTTAFLDGDRAWVGVAMQGPGRPRVATFRTVDGGRSWHIERSGATEAIVSGWLTFVDSDHGWLLSGLGAATGSEGVDLLQSTDGGVHWTSVSRAIGGVSPPPGSIPFGCRKTGVSFLNVSTGWITGNCYGGAPFLYRTQDSGRSWQYQVLPPPASYPSPQLSGDIVVDPPAFVTQHDGVISLGPVTLDGVERSILYITRDGGQTWRPTTPVPAGRPVVAVLTREHWLVAAKGQLFVTRDGGSSWNEVPVSGPSLSGIVQLNFVNDRIGWARGLNPQAGDVISFLLKTTDGGKTWTGVRLPGES